MSKLSFGFFSSCWYLLSILFCLLSYILGCFKLKCFFLDTNANFETLCLSESEEYCPGTKRPLWFVYSGMVSQWATVGADLMRIPVFAAAIQK